MLPITSSTDVRDMLGPTTSILRSHTRSGVVRTQVGRRGVAAIICEAWPAWLFILSALHIDCHTVIITSRAPAWLPYLQQFCPQVQFWLNWESIQTTNMTSVDWWLLHGSPQWVACQMPYLSQKAVIVSYSYSGLVSPSHTKHTCSISSSAAGSVVDALWWFDIPCDIALMSPPTMYRRFLRHIINPATSSRFHHDTSAACVLSAEGPLPITQLHYPVECRSVFNGGNVTIRPLSVEELGRAFDLPPPLVKLFLSMSRFSLPWLSSPPLKVLTHVGRMIFGGGMKLQVTQVTPKDWEEVVQI